MTKREMIRWLADDMDTTQVVAEKWLNRVLDRFEAGLKADRRVVLRGFGRLFVKDLAPRRVVSPWTGMLHEIPACKSVGFKPSPFLRTAIDGQEGGCR